MGREVACPKCGAAHQVVNPGITTLVCSSCHAVVYWGADGALQVGSESILPANQSRLFLFASGALDGVTYQVVGHVRYDYGHGTWDEWYLQTDDGRSLWVSEDERVITEEAPVDASAAPPYGSLKVGTPVDLGGTVYTVRELATATCVGSEGQLPLPVFPGDSYPYADLASEDGTSFATLEYAADGARAFAGRVVGHDRLTVEGEPPPAATQEQGRGITCANCGGSLELPANRQVATKVCEYCGTQLDLSTAELSILGQNREGYRPPFILTVGQAGTLGGDRYEVAGRAVYSDQEAYESREYLLFNPSKGYLWLGEYQGHYTLLSESHAEPKSFKYYATASTQVAGQPYRVYEWGTETITYVDGALPWKAYVGQSHNFCTLINPPLVYDIETDGQEREFFSGRYVSNDELWKAFELSGDPPKPSTIGAAQPYERPFALKWLMIAGGALAAINLCFALWAAAREPEQIVDLAVIPDMELGEAYSEPFRLSAGQIVSIDVAAQYGSPWEDVTVRFVPEDDRGLAAAKKRAEEKGKPSSALIHSVPGSSYTSWTPEGSQEFRTPATGRYRVYADAKLGSGFKLSSVKGDDADAKNDRVKITNKLKKVGERQRAVRVTISGRIVRAGYFVWAMVICLLLPIFGFWRKRAFEAKRWEPVLD